LVADLQELLGRHVVGAGGNDDIRAAVVAVRGLVVGHGRADGEAQYRCPQRNCQPGRTATTPPDPEPPHVHTSLSTDEHRSYAESHDEKAPKPVQQVQAVTKLL